MTIPLIPVESFFDPVFAEVWPKDIATQVAQRKELIECLNDVTDLETSQATKLYASLSELLESDQDYRRLVLYLPFELLPKAPERFKQAYLKVWSRLLFMQDVRANFVDGDILEEDQQNDTLPRVVKAAHLIPKLVECGFIKVEDVLTFLKEIDDPILKDSIADTLPVLADLGFLDPKEIRPRIKLIKPEPKIITEKRKKWLEWKKEQAVQPRQLSVIGDRQLAGPFSKNLGLMKEEIAKIENLVAAIESDPELSKLIYPVVIMFGSRLNGYGDQNADLDFAVFVKPGASFVERKRLKELLNQEEFTEFWLEEKKEQLQVRNFADFDAHLGKKHWTHVLFGGAWIGNTETMRELYKKLLLPYIYEDGEIRRSYLEEMERSTLQYRLMHKGYKRFFAPCGGIHTKHAAEIDGESMFWDSGYRQLATKLFISRIFLPKLPINQK